MSYNIETILSEKFETIISRGTLNTRMRDYYDVYILLTING
ncbi:MAG: nucleotidyl transferase AbiEii/AbiGii toxin family protein, partial [Erysipelothrix sp.]|nr:nucleotidyl transferase AbiEii/AbiGii toxin family protein [Erysipelothrix sp.]